MLKGISAPEGTLLGPGREGRIFVVAEQVEGGVMVNFATPMNIREALNRAEPHSVAEVQMIRQRRAMLARAEAAQRVSDGIEAMARRLMLSRPGPTHRKNRAGGGR